MCQSYSLRQETCSLPWKLTSTYFPKYQDETGLPVLSPLTGLKSIFCQSGSFSNIKWSPKNILLRALALKFDPLSTSPVPSTVSHGRTLNFSANLVTPLSTLELLHKLSTDLSPQSRRWSLWGCSYCTLGFQQSLWMLYYIPSTPSQGKHLWF